MSTVDRRVFDRGFAHAYPRDRGLIETISPEYGRIIIEPILANDSVHEQLAARDFPLFPERTLDHERIHVLPTDSRDLTDMIRLSRDEAKVATLGLILGHRLRQIHDMTHQLPIDTILPRFAVHSQAVGSIATSGIDIKLLPPFDRFSNEAGLDDTPDLILSDLLDMGTVLTPKQDAFLDGVSDGINMGT